MHDLLRKNTLAFGFLFGIIFGILTTSIAHPKQVPIVPVVIEKQVIVKVPVRLTNFDKKQIACLTDNISYESNNQSDNGKAAVAHVVLNRIKERKFGNTACSVITQKRNNTCQFSWVCHTKAKIDSDDRIENKRIAENVYLGNIPDNTGGATYYHAKWMKTYPMWSNKFKKTTRIESHIFYSDS
jgi:spore germination cell wall hydrolase CwlJ-like protein